MAVSLKIKRGTRAQLDAAAGASGLAVGEPYLITDEDRIAVGTSATTYATYAKASEITGNEAEDWGLVTSSPTASADYGSIV